MMSVQKFIFIGLILQVGAVASVQPFGEGSKTGVSEPGFVALEEGQGSYSATVHDGRNAIKIKDTSFSGRTKIGGIRSEKDDSVMRLKLSKIKKISIVNPSYTSSKYADKQYVLAKVKTSTGATIDGVLIPCGILISGIEEATHIERVWRIDRIDKLTIHNGKKPRMRIKRSVRRSSEDTNHDTMFPPRPKKASAGRGILNAIEGIFGAIYDLITAIVGFFIRLVS